MPAGAPRASSRRTSVVGIDDRDRRAACARPSARATIPCGPQSSEWCQPFATSRAASDAGPSAARHHDQPGEAVLVAVDRDRRAVGRPRERPLARVTTSAPRGRAARRAAARASEPSAAATQTLHHPFASDTYASRDAVGREAGLTHRHPGAAGDGPRRRARRRRARCATRRTASPGRSHSSQATPGSATVGSQAKSRTAGHPLGPAARRRARPGRCDMRHPGRGRSAPSPFARHGRERPSLRREDPGRATRRPGTATRRPSAAA